MDINIINECTELSLAGKITFPEGVKKLASSGVERYMCDLIGLKKLSYGSNGESHISELNFKAEEVAEYFNAESIKNAIKESQQGIIDYQTFLKDIIQAGCCHYEVFIKGKKVIYFGRDGSHHIELFPTSK